MATKTKKEKKYWLRQFYGKTGPMYATLTEARAEAYKLSVKHPGFVLDVNIGFPAYRHLGWVNTGLDGTVYIDRTKDDLTVAVYTLNKDGTLGRRRR